MESYNARLAFLKSSLKTTMLLKSKWILYNRSLPTETCHELRVETEKISDIRCSVIESLSEGFSYLNFPFSLIMVLAEGHRMKPATLKL
jgi:hypothetical protein